MPNQFSLQLRTPFTMLIAGPTKAGKTSFTNNLIASCAQLYSSPPNVCFYFYNQKPPKHHALSSLISGFYEGLPSMSFLEQMYKTYGPNCTVIIDDQALNVTKEVSELFSVGSSRYEANIIFITQNLFGKVKGSRDISINCTYLVVFKNPRDGASIMHLFRQFAPQAIKAHQSIYKDATQDPYSYLMLDCHQCTVEEHRLISNIFGENKKYPVMYQIA